MSWLYVIVSGLIIGALARAITPGRQAMGWIATILLGIGGSVLAHLIGGLLGIRGPAGFLGSLFGAVILLWAVNRGRR